MAAMQTGNERRWTADRGNFMGGDKEGAVLRPAGPVCKDYSCQFLSKTRPPVFDVRDFRSAFATGFLIPRRHILLARSAPVAQPDRATDF
jgi:hypothetical protein